MIWILLFWCLLSLFLVLWSHWSPLFILGSLAPFPFTIFLPIKSNYYCKSPVLVSCPILQFIWYFAIALPIALSCSARTCLYSFEMSPSPATCCLGCGKRRQNSSKWYNVPENVPNKMLFLNDLRARSNQSGNSKRKRLSPLTEAPLNGVPTICAICYSSGKLMPNEAALNCSKGGGQSIQLKRHQSESLPRKELRRSKRLRGKKDSRPMAMEQDPDGNGSSDDGQEIEEDFMRKTNSSHRFCIFRCDEGPLMDVPRAIRAKLHMHYNLYLPSASCRMCVRHLATEDWWPLVRTINTPVPPEDYLEIMRLDRVFYKEKESGSLRGCYDLGHLQAIPDNPFEAIFGFSKEQVEEISQVSQCQPRHTAAFLVKMRTGESNKMLGALFGISERTFGRHFTRAKLTMHPNMVTAHLTATREKMVDHRTVISDRLLNVPENSGVVAFDASYRFVQKSDNYRAQRQLHCLYKTRNCYKPMVGVAPDGYILFCLGPYQAKKNDASILRQSFDEEELELLQAGDVLVTDRGFRDVLPFLRELGFQVKIPSGTAATRLCTLEANRNRLVTKVRWIIEQVFGRIKKRFKYLDYVCHNSTLGFDFPLFQIACSLLNMFHRPILSDRSFPGIAEAMLARLAVENKLQTLVAELSLEGARIVFNRLQDNGRIIARRFPQLTPAELHMLAFGSYQPRNARSYFGQHMEDNRNIFLLGEYQGNIDYRRFNIDVDEPMLLKAKIHSRFTGRKQHYAFVLADRAKVGRQAIIEYYCSCATGTRTVGCCSHVMTIIWFVAFAHSLLVRGPNPALSHFAK